MGRKGFAFDVFIKLVFPTAHIGTQVEFKGILHRYALAVVLVRISAILWSAMFF